MEGTLTPVFRTSVEGTCDARVVVPAPFLFSRRMYPMTRRTRSAGLLALLVSASTTLVVALPAASSGAATASTGVVSRLAREPDVATKRTGDSRSFSLAVVPDTQGEVFGGDTRLANRTRWLVRRAGALDLRFVIQVGDLHQLGRVYSTAARQGVGGLQGPRGRAHSLHRRRRQPRHTRGRLGRARRVRRRRLRRQPGVLAALQLVGVPNAGAGAPRPGDQCPVPRSPASATCGRSGSGKIITEYSTFEAGGLNWLVLDLELWPRARCGGSGFAGGRDDPRYNVVIKITRTSRVAGRSTAVPTTAARAPSTSGTTWSASTGTS